MGAHRRALSACLALALGASLVARAPDARATEPAKDVALDLTAPVVADWEPWKGLSFGTYLTPKSDFVAKDGGVDVVFHFHAGQMAERQMKESGTNAVFVSCGYGIGSGAYAKALANPERFGRMLDEVIKNLETQTGRKGLHVRHLALASWSAGFAAVGKILAVERYYAMVDSVVLNDSLHSQYLDPNPKTASQGAERVDLRMIRSFVRFAKDATKGEKTMVVTHSAIIPPDYASSTEATQALLTAIDVPSSVVDDAASADWRGMTLAKRADAGNLHVRGFRGRGPKDHFEHLYLLGEVLRTW
ncbi:MAG: uncharacterized protein JWP87_431, partial [Labilithrix sp.]|nr:uncharacterized protein [Labilithrix sp.]